MKRWVGLGVIADNLIHIGDTLSKRYFPKNRNGEVSWNQNLK
jgi:hypothetical protein